MKRTREIKRKWILVFLSTFLLATVGAFAETPDEVIKYCENMAACTRKEAYRASEEQIVFHYGKHIEYVEALAAGLTEQGFPAVALKGGPKNGIEMRVNKSSVVKLTQEDVNLGTAAGLAADLYKVRIANKEQPSAKDTELTLKQGEVPQNPVTTSPLFKEASVPPEKESRFQTYEECMGEDGASLHVCAEDEASHYSQEHENSVGVYINYAATPEMPPELLESVLADGLKEDGITNYKITSSISKGKNTIISFIVDGSIVTEAYINAEARQKATEAANMAKGGVIKATDVPDK